MKRTKIGFGLGLLFDGALITYCVLFEYIDKKLAIILGCLLILLFFFGAFLSIDPNKDKKEKK